MVASKVILAVAVVSAIAFAQVEAKPSSTAEDWTGQFEAAFKNITSTVTEFVGNHSPITDDAKKNLNSYVDTFKSELASFTKTLENRPGISDIVKNVTQQYHTAVDSLNKNLPTDLTPQKLTERFQETQKTITTHANELWKKVQGNSDLEKEVKEFTKKQYDALTVQFQEYQKKLAELNKN